VPYTAHLGSRDSFPGARGRLRLRPSTEMHMSSRRKEVLLPSAGNPWLPYLHSSVANLVKSIVYLRDQTFRTEIFRPN